MKIIKLRFRNFGSYGNKIHEVKFTDNGKFYLVVGGNGLGKSTILNVITWLLYGKVPDKKNSEIPNIFNGNVWGEIILQKDVVTQIVIERTLKTIKCVTDINGKKIEYDQAGKKNIQNYIEDEIIKIPYYLFNNIIGLSVNDFKSFLSMNPNNKRKIIDKVCGLEIINRIRDFLKNEIKETKEQLLILDNEITILNESIQSSAKELDKLNEKLKINSADKIKKIKKDREEYIEYIKTAEAKINEIKTKSEKLSEIKESTNSKINQLNIFFSQYKQKKKLYQNEKCPECESSLKTKEHLEKIDEWEKEYTFKSEEFNKFKGVLNNIKTKEKKLQQIYSKISNQKYTAENYLSHKNKQLKELSGTENQDKSEESTSLSNLINETTNKVEKSKKNQLIFERKKNFYNILDDIFGDKGVKLLAIKKILPALNLEIDNIVKKLNLGYKIYFNEEFNSNIYYLGHSVSSSMLSTGERKKLDFAVLIAIIKLLKTKYQGLNVFFLDEIFSSIDSDGIYQILNILKDICRELDLNIFTINHSLMPTELFDYVIEVYKEDQFSQFRFLSDKSSK